MTGPEDNESEIEKAKTPTVSGIGQKVLGEIEKLAGVINADPLAQAEGEFNIEVGDIRNELEDELPEEKNETSS
ncbi:MAG TPA: hypothetical protein PKC89_09570 [Pyrinomonadaceae bacterium]|nr:hypothetical protein [Pyrinomonadaceae bacterium]